MLSRIADMVGCELDGPFVEAGQKGFGKGNLGHDVGLEGRVESAWLGGRRQFGELKVRLMCGSREDEEVEFQV